jgi:hypothetical protein
MQKKNVILMMLMAVAAADCGGEQQSPVSAARAQGLGTTTRIEQNAPAVTYAGTWFTNTSQGHSGGSAVLGTEPGATATVTFTGTGVHWIGYRDQWSGIASVFLDGDFLQTVDTYAPGGEYQALTWSLEGLPLAQHTLTIMALGLNGPNSAQGWVWIDAFDIVNGTPGPAPGNPWPMATRTEDGDPSIALSGTWFRDPSGMFSGGSAILSEEAGATATFSFIGSRVRWVGYRDQYSGIGHVLLDGNLVAVYDTFADPAQAQTVVFQTGALTLGTHTLAIEAMHQHFKSATEKWVWIDAFDVVH